MPNRQYSLRLSRSTISHPPISHPPISHPPIQWIKLPAMTKSLTKLDVCIFHYYFKSLTLHSNFQLAQAKFKSNWASGRLAISCTAYITPTNIMPTNITPTHITPTYITSTNITPTYITPTNIRPTNITPTYITPTYITHLYHTHQHHTHLYHTHLYHTHLYHSLSSSLPGQNGCHFADNIFKCISPNEKALISIKISLKFVPKGPINNIPALVQIMAWRRPGDKPLSEPILTQLTEEYIPN